jgi:hypothetical protein
MPAGGYPAQELCGLVLELLRHCSLDIFIWAEATDHWCWTSPSVRGDIAEPSETFTLPSREGIPACLWGVSSCCMTVPVAMWRALFKTRCAGRWWTSLVQSGSVTLWLVCVWPSQESSRGL